MTCLSKRQNSEYNKMYRLRNRDEISRKRRERYFAHHEKMLARCRLYNTSGRGRYSSLNKFARLNGHAPLNCEKSDFLAWYESVDKTTCQCCCRQIKKLPQVDHCHRTGRVRGILCHRCNTGLGYLENAAWINKAEAYLSRDQAVRALAESGLLGAA